jgi:hypothetical protein
MPPIPGLQGVRPLNVGGISDIPSLSGGGGLQGIPSLGVQAPSARLEPTRPKFSAAMDVLERVRLGRMSVDSARKSLSSLSDEERDQLRSLVIQRQQSTSAPLPKNQLAALEKKEPRGFLGSVLHETGKLLERDPTIGGIMKITRAEAKGNIPVASAGARDIEGAVKGFMPGLYVSGRAVGKDVGTIGKNVVQDPFGRTKLSELRTTRDVVKPIAKQYAHTYGPLAHGDLAEFAHRVGQHPLGPALDLLALVSAGVGTAGRVAAASKAVELGRVEPLASGSSVVGGRYYVNPLKSGRYSVRDSQWQQSHVPGSNPFRAVNMPDEASAIAHAQSLSTGGIHGSTLARALVGGTRGGSKGHLIQAYERAAGVSHVQENAAIAKEIVSVLDDKNLPLNRRNFTRVWKDMAKDLQATAQRDIGAVANIKAEQPLFGSKAVAVPLKAGLVAARELNDLVRASAIYLRGAYLPNNWAGNLFFSLVHQGVFSPVNLGKSFAMDKALGTRYRKAVDASLGMNPATSILSEKGRGYISATSRPVAEFMGNVADQPFRRGAWLHEARKKGYRTLSDVKKLIDTAYHGIGASAASDAAIQEMADIGRLASEEIGKFGRMNKVERDTLRNIVFVYSWMRAAGRYSYRFPMAHPIQAAVDSHIGQVGSDWTNKEMGGVPSFLVGAIPVGHDSKGNPLLINPFSVNPLTTGLQEWAAVKGAVDIVRGKPFDKYSQQDVITGLLNPPIQSYLQGWAGGKDFPTNIKQSMAWWRLNRELRHPGSGSIYPTTRAEAIGHFTAGGFYPRKADQAAITRSLVREGAAHPAALIPEQLKAYKNATGESLPPDLIKEYKADLKMVEGLKNFQHDYARQHGQSGFRNLPAQNRLEAALIWYEQYGGLAKEDMDALHIEAKQVQSDTEANDLANALFSETGIGSVKREWDDAMREARGMHLTRMRQ